MHLFVSWSDFFLPQDFPAAFRTGSLLLLARRASLKPGFDELQAQDMKIVTVRFRCHGFDSDFALETIVSFYFVG